jgi:hypothetical protein
MLALEAPGHIEGAERFRLLRNSVARILDAMRKAADAAH